MPGKAWDGTIVPPLGGRMPKPRAEGWTMVLDKSMGRKAAGDWLDLCGDYVDLLKLTFGTSVFYRPDLLKRKTGMARAHGVGVMPGGTLAEVALLQKSWPAYLERAKALGFDFLEISDGTIDLPRDQRLMAIRSACEEGFQVVTEVGKKHEDDRIAVEAQIEQALFDLEAGAVKVIVEGRESGRNVGIYGSQGEIRPDLLAALAEGLPPEAVIWEAPLKKQQEELIVTFGPNVSLGNIAPEDVLALEALRQGLRGDTLRAVLRGEMIFENANRDN